LRRTADTASPTTLASGRQTVTTGGTAVALATTSAPALQLEITAETDNTGLIVVGDSTVVAALATRKGTPLNAGDTLTLYGVDLKDVYLDATVNTDGVTYLAVGGA
jgi:hypothetical protein